jgi:colanic acid/amylovoran biosynthesis glycosyltransferase
LRKKKSISNAKRFARFFVQRQILHATVPPVPSPQPRVTIIILLSDSPQIRIAYLVSQYPAVTHTFILREIIELRRLGFDIRVASIRGPDRPLEQLASDEQEEQRATFYVKPKRAAGILAVNFRMLFKRPFRYLRSLAYAVGLAGLNARAALFNLAYFAEAAVVADWMRRQALSHIHMHFTSTVGLLALRMAPMRASVTIHGPDEFTDPTGFYLTEKIHAFHLLCTISEYGRSQLMRFSDHSEWAKFRVAHLGVDPTLYAPGPFRENPSPFEILFVGRLAPVKGPDILIAALDRLVRQGRRVRLRFAGDGPSRPGLERSTAERGLNQNVVFEGWQNAGRVRALYQQADIFALPSFAEGIPVVLMEAMSMEIPCVTTRITGIPELIRDQIDGLLVTPSSEEELAAAMERLLDNPDLRRQLGKSARQRILEHYDLRHNTGQLAAIFREFAAGSTKASAP